MCPPAAPIAPARQSELAWRVEKERGTWRLLVEAKARPEVDICEHSVRLAPQAGGEPTVVALPEEALPVDLGVVKCTYSRKRGQIVVEWPASKVGAEQQQQQQQQQQQAADFPAELGKAVEPEVPPMEATEDASSAPEALEGPPLGAERQQVEESPAAAEEVVEAGEPLVEAAKAAGTAMEALEDPQPVLSADEWKARGNAAVATGDHNTAAEHYSRGLRVEPRHAILLSNRALCLHKLGRLDEALTDARTCAALRPDFWKGHLRAALVLRDLGRPVEALDALRKAGKHEEIERLSAELRPEIEAVEAARIAGLGGAERRKEEGNALFKRGLFEQALGAYNEAFALCESDASGELALSIQNNRAACYHQLSDFSAVVADATAVLEHQPDNLKALVRRMIALEPLEKHELALEDARRVLRFCPGHAAANRVQHRLGKLVRDRQREQCGGA